MKRLQKEKEFFVIQRALAGDQTAFTELFNRNKKFLLYQVYKIVRDMDVTNDIVMETFMKAFTLLVNYKPEYSFSTWVLRIGINAAIDYFRRKSIERIVSIDSCDEDNEDTPLMQLRDDSILADEILDEKVLAKHVEEMLGQVDEIQRRIMELHFYDGMTYAEISEELNIPVNTIKVKVHRAKELLNDIKMGKL